MITQIQLDEVGLSAGVYIPRTGEHTISFMSDDNFELTLKSHGATVGTPKTNMWDRTAAVVINQDHEPISVASGLWYYFDVTSITGVVIIDIAPVQG